MKVDVQAVSEQLVKVSVELPLELVQQEYAKASRRIAQRINVPGFRRGRAPLRIVEKMVGAENIKMETLDRYLPSVFATVVMDNELDVVAPPRILELDFELGQPLKLQAELDLRPVVKVASLALKAQVVKVSESPEAVETRLAELVKSKAKLALVTDRAVCESDVLMLDFEGKLADGSEVPGGVATDFSLDMANNHLIDGFCEQLVGQSVGKPCVVSVTFPSDYFDASLAGQQAAFDVTVKEIKALALPELTDALAVELGAADVAGLKASVAKELTELNEADLLRRQKKAVVDALLASVDVSIPEGMIERESQLLMDNLDRQFKAQGLSLTDMLNNVGRENALANFRQEAIQRIKTSLTFAAVAKQESLSVSDEQFSAEVVKIADARGIEEKALMRQLASQPKGIQAITDQVLASQVVDLLMSKASFEMVDALPENSVLALEETTSATAQEEA
jgi:trigger factor